MQHNTLNGTRKNEINANASKWRPIQALNNNNNDGVICIIDYDRSTVYHFVLHSFHINLSAGEKNVILLLRFFRLIR